MYKMKKIPNANYDYYDVPKIRDLKELIELRKDSASVAFMYRKAASISVTRRGAQPSVPTAAEVF